MTFQCTLNTRLKKIGVVAAKSKQYSPFLQLVSNTTEEEKFANSNGNIFQIKEDS